LFCVILSLSPELVLKKVGEQNIFLQGKQLSPFLDAAPTLTAVINIIKNNKGQISTLNRIHLEPV